MIDLSYLPVSDPIKFFVFMFLPGFLIFSALRYQYRNRVDELLSRLKVFDERIDSIIWCVLLGLSISIFVSLFFSFMSFIFSFAPEWLISKHIKTIISDGDIAGRDTLMGVISYLTILWIVVVSFLYNLDIGNIRRFILLCLMLILLLVIETGFLDYLINQPNPLVEGYRELIIYSGNVCNANYTIDGRKYCGVNVLRDVVVINPSDKPMAMWVDSCVFIFKEIQNNNSNEYMLIRTPKVIEPNAAFRFNILANKYANEKEGWVYVKTSQGMVPLSYKCD